MARREDIVNTFWDEVDHLSDDGTMLYLWSWTNTKCGMAGIYRIARRKLIEGRFSEDRLSAALAELEEDGKLFYEDGVLWCAARVKRLSSIHETIAKSIAKDLGEIDPSHPLFRRFVERYGGHPNLKPLLTLPRSSSEGPEDPDTEPDTGPSLEGQATVLGRGRGSGQGSGEFEDWLENYREVTGKSTVRGSKPAREAFAARRKEGRTLDELKAATVGCHGDDFCRENGHDVPETILRASKVERYIQLGAGVPVPVRDERDWGARREDAERIWASASEALRGPLGESTWNIWIEPIRALGTVDDALLLGMPEGQRAWGERKYAGLIGEAVAAAEPSIGHLRFTTLDQADARAAA